MKKILSLKFISLLIIFILSLWQCRFLLLPGFYTFSDETHIANLYEMIRTLRLGQFPPRWAPDFSYNFGHPFFNFYYLLPYLIGSIFHLIFGLNLIWSLKLVFLTATLGSGLTMYFLSLKLFHRSHIALACAIIYLFTPYRAVDLYVRGAVGEIMAFAFLPLAVLALLRLIDRRRLTNLICTVFTLALLILSHNLSLIILIPFILLFLLAYIFLYSPRTCRPKAILWLAGSFFATALLTAFYWLPLLLEKSYLQSGTPFNPIDHFPFIKQLILPSWGYGASVWGPGDQLSFQIGAVNLLVVILASILAFRHFNNHKWLAVGIIAPIVLAVLAMNIRSWPLWQLIPVSSYIQFPWRFLMVTTFFSSLAIGFLSLSRHKTVSRRLPLILTFMACTFTYSYFRPHTLMPVNDNYFLNRFFINQSTSGPSTTPSSIYHLNSEDYLPLTVWTKTRPSSLPPKFDFPPTVELVSSDTGNPFKLSAITQSPQSYTLKINTYYFPGWQAQIDGLPAPIKPADSTGRIALNVPEGLHQIQIFFTNTPIRAIANYISLVTFVCLVFLLLPLSWHKRLLLGILTLGLFFRLYRLGNLPPSLNWDEISHAYNAYSLSRTGLDQWHQPWPVFNFRAYGDYPTALNLYLTLPLIKLFGLNPWTSRLPTAIMGFLLVPLSYILGRQIFKNKNSALLLALLTAVSPWTLFPSRAVFQSTISQTIILAGIIASLKGLKKTIWLIPGFSFMALSGYAYHNNRIAAPLLIVFFIYIFRHQFAHLLHSRSRHLIIASVVSLTLILPLLYQFLNPQSRARSQWVFILNDAAINEINNLRASSTAPPFIARLEYNKLTYTLPRIIANYLEFINPIPLFFQGSTNHQFNVPGQGILFSAWLPFFYIGLVLLIRHIRHDRLSRFLLGWFVIGLIPSVITFGDFPVIRAMSILPLPLVFIVIGINQTQKLLSSPYLRRNFMVIILTLVALQFAAYWRSYSNNYFRQYSASWQYGYQQAINLVKSKFDQYNQIIFTKKYGEPHEFILFYWPWEPQNYQNDANKVWDYHSGWYWVDAFDKFRFVNDWQIKDIPTYPSSTLLITSPGNWPTQNAKLQSTIYYLDHTPVFDIVSYETP